ncbi:MAG: regulatory protein RecX [Armatimonadetes bacterium]|nr:regulatory protein RecX [Armatimonadota bacterium]
MTKRTALDEAVRFLAKAERSEAEVRRRLASREYEEAEIEDAISRLRDLNYLNEERMAHQEVEDLSTRKLLGKHRVNHRLESRGVDEEIREQAVAEIEEGDELKRACLLLQRKYKSDDDFAKAGRFLFSRGFDEEVVQSALARHFPAYEEF